MPSLNIEVDTKKVSAALESAPKKVGIALLRSTKRGTKAAQTIAKRVVAKDMGLKVSDVLKYIRLKEPTAQTLCGELRASLKRIPLIKFGARGGRGGVRYRGKGGRSRHPHAFIAKMPTGHIGVFEREGTKSLPIRQLYGASVGRVFSEHQGEILARGEEVVNAELDRLVDRIFE